MEMPEEDAAYKTAKLLLKIKNYLKKHVLPYKLAIGLTLMIIGVPLLLTNIILNIVNTDAAIWFVIDKNPLQPFVYLSKYCFWLGMPSIILGILLLSKAIIDETRIINKR